MRFWSKISASSCLRVYQHRPLQATVRSLPLHNSSLHAAGRTWHAAAVLQPCVLTMSCLSRPCTVLWSHRTPCFLSDAAPACTDCVPTKKQYNTIQYKLIKVSLARFFAGPGLNVKRLKPSTALHGKPISEVRGVTCHIGSHSVARHQTRVNAPPITPANQAGIRFTYPGGMEG